jgi:hypothetical protein
MSDCAVGGNWINRPTVWRVTYEYADGEGGGVRTDHFRTGARYTLPTTTGVVRALEDQDITLIGFESIECFCTDLPGDVSNEVPEDSHAGSVFDLIDHDCADAYFVEATDL